MRIVIKQFAVKKKHVTVVFRTTKNKNPASDDRARCEP